MHFTVFRWGEGAATSTVSNRVTATGYEEALHALAITNPSLMIEGTYLVVRHASTGPAGAELLHYTPITRGTVRRVYNP